MLGLFKRNKKKPEKEAALDERLDFMDEYVTVEQNAVVADQYCYVETVGIKHPKTVKRFVVVFETKENERLALPVMEEMYHGFEIGQRGLLKTVEDEFYSFEL